jgi:hypothetical protein
MYWGRSYSQRLTRLASLFLLKKRWAKDPALFSFARFAKALRLGEKLFCESEGFSPSRKVNAKTATLLFPP